MGNFTIYSRRSLSDFLQMARQAEISGHKLPGEIIAAVQVAHDSKLPHRPSKLQVKKKTSKKKESVCKLHGTNLFKLECGKMICWDCYGNV